MDLAIMQDFTFDNFTHLNDLSLASMQRNNESYPKKYYKFKLSKKILFDAMIFKRHSYTFPIHHISRKHIRKHLFRIAIGTNIEGKKNIQDVHLVLNHN